MHVRRENEMWEIVNRKRRKRKVMNTGIGMEEWNEHFMKLMGGVNRRVMRGEGGRGEEGGGEEGIV